MLDQTFKLRVFSGRGLEAEATVRSVNVPSLEGELGFLPEHCEFVGLLATGMIEYVGADGAASRCLVSGGICTFNDNVLTLLADTVDIPGFVDTELLSEDLDNLRLQLQAMSLFDPEWEGLSQRVARLDAVRSLATS